MLPHLACHDYLWELVKGSTVFFSLFLPSKSLSLIQQSFKTSTIVTYKSIHNKSKHDLVLTYDIGTNENLIL